MPDRVPTRRAGSGAAVERLTGQAGRSGGQDSIRAAAILPQVRRNADTLPVPDPLHRVRTVKTVRDRKLSAIWRAHDYAPFVLKEAEPKKYS